MNMDNFVGQCRLGCFGMGIGAGVLAVFIISQQTGFFAALLVGIALGVFLALVMIQLFCWEDEEEETTEASKPRTYVSPEGPALSAPKTPFGTSNPAAPAAGNPLLATKHAPVPDAPSKHAAKAPAKQAAPKSAKAPATPAPEQAPIAAKAASPVEASDARKPAGLSEARGGAPDNLKEIKGVGPKLEALLHSLGFYHFDQIAGWSAEEAAWVDDNLKGFKGRATRDKWIEQSKILAAGGETEFSKRVDKGGVY